MNEALYLRPHFKGLDLLLMVKNLQPVALLQASSHSFNWWTSKVPSVNIVFSSSQSEAFPVPATSSAGGNNGHSETPRDVFQ